jgi:hypothetical protein
VGAASSRNCWHCWFRRSSSTRAIARSRLHSTPAASRRSSNNHRIGCSLDRSYRTGQSNQSIKRIVYSLKQLCSIKEDNRTHCPTRYLKQRSCHDSLARWTPAILFIQYAGVRKRNPADFAIASG